MGIRVLALVTEAYGGRGGIAAYNRDMLRALCEHPGVDEVVALPRLLPEPPQDMPGKLSYLEAAVGGKLRYALAVLNAARRGGGYDLILCAHINLLPLAALAGAVTRAPQLLGIYGIDAWQPTPGLLANRLARRVKHFFSISELTCERFLQWTGLPPGRGAILPNAIHLEAYGVAERSGELLARYGLDQDQDNKIIMTLGRLSAAERYKGVDEILDVLPGLLKAVPKLHYLVVGEGDDRHRLMEKAANMQLKDHVTFTGRIDEAGKADHFRLADIYVMPSQGEGFGFVFLEAMACGIPVVASETDGGAEALRNGELGTLVDPQDKKALHEAIMEALKRPRRIPEGLDYFAFPRFRQRLHGMLESIGVVACGN